jgi:hypothetical protein
MDADPVTLEAQVTMNFADAINELANGKIISRLEWANPLIFCSLRLQVIDGKDEWIAMIHQKDGVFYPWTLSLGDMLGTDWVVV